jgi:hypothetical protein
MPTPSSRTGQIRPLQPDLLRYHCGFSAITRRAPAPARVTQLLRECLTAAHSDEPPRDRA